MGISNFDTLGRLAARLPGETDLPTTPSVYRRMGVIVNVKSSGADVYLGDSSTLVPDLAWIGSYRPVKGDTVWVDLVGSNFVIAGRSSPTPAIATAPTAPTLLNSFTNLGAPYQTARYWRDAQGWVHIDGIVSRGSTTTLPIFTLPVGFRPNKTQRFLAICGPTAQLCEIDVEADGDVLVAAKDASGTFSGVSLCGIMFQTSDVFAEAQWTPLDASTWTQSTADITAQPRVFLRDDGWVRADALYTGSYTGFIHVPDDAKIRYAQTFLVAGYTSPNIVATRWDINSGGLAPNAGATAQVAIESMQWMSRYVEESWVSNAPINSWTNFGGGFAPFGYMVDKFDVVHCRGLVTGGTVPSALQITAMPAGLRPAAQQIFPAESNNGIGRVDVDTSGRLIPQAGNTAYFDLSQVLYLAEQ
jgi:hypothetical protein